MNSEKVNNIDTNYYLTKIFNKKVFNIKQLSEDEYNQYCFYVNSLRKLITNESLYLIIEKNYDDIESAINFYESKFGGVHHLSIVNFSEIRLDMNRLILNYLSAVKTFLEHTETRLKREFGENSTRYSDFKSYTSNAFDNNFSYRFLYKLRNYAQHCGLPSGSIAFNAQSDNKGGIYNKLTVYFDRDDLLNKYDGWGSKVKPDLLLQGEKFNVLDLINEMSVLLLEINQKVNAPCFLNEKMAAETLLQLLIESNDSNGFPCLTKTYGDATNLKLNLNWFPIDAISRVTGVLLDYEEIN